MQPIVNNVSALRHVPWGGASGDQDIVIMGLNWSASTLSLQVRPTPGDTSTPLVSLANAAAGSEGISVTYDAGYIYPANGPHTALIGTVVGATTIRPQINQATLEAIPLPSDPTQPLGLSYDIHITPPGLPKMQLAYGSFTLFPGVTI